MWFKIFSFLSFLIQSTNQHKVHSPFVFNFVTKCLYKSPNKQKLNTFKLLKNQFLNSKSQIIVTDFGAGSKVFKSNQRKISQIANNAGVTNKKAGLLISLIEYFSIQSILEIGTSIGLSTSAMKIANLKSKIITLEGCKETANVARNSFNSQNYSDIKIEVGNFDETISNAIKTESFDFIYFDGNHTKEATVNYFNLCVEKASNSSIFIFDDIYWSKDMLMAWEQIKKHPKVTVTINTYFWGIVFFRTEQPKQHFIIRV